jgi:hypothetical protein
MKHILLHHKHRLDTHNFLPRAKEEAIRRHFGLGLPRAGR